MTCNVFERLYDNIVNHAGEGIANGLIPAVADDPLRVIEGQWYCGHGLIALLPGPGGTPVPFHNVDPALVGKQYETTTVADGT